STRLVTKWYRTEDEAWSYPNEVHRARLNAILGITLPEPQEVSEIPARHDLYTVEGGRAESDHPCEKPLGVVRDIISRLGTMILDPFVGSGTSLVAARQVGVQCVGIDVDDEHCQRAVTRLRQRE